MCFGHTNGIKGDVVEGDQPSPLRRLTTDKISTPTTDQSTKAPTPTTTPNEVFQAPNAHTVPESSQYWLIVSKQGTTSSTFREFAKRSQIEGLATLWTMAPGRKGIRQLA